VEPEAARAAGLQSLSPNCLQDNHFNSVAPRLFLGLDKGALPMNTDWMARGKCRDIPPGVFFPSDGLGVQAAQRICEGCPVAETCLEYALANRIDHGVWGGCSERERRRILRRRRVPLAITARS
jgi:WhiB family redox-sensing transcriptional regulator